MNRQYIVPLDVALKVQREQLNDWKKVLLPHVYNDLEKWATENNSSKTMGNDIIRGSSLDNFIVNYNRNYTPPN